MRRVWIYAALAPFLVVALFPVFWMVITAFKDDRDLYSMRGIPFWFYEPPTLKHFHLLFTQTWFGAWFVNTALVSVCVVAITLATAVPAGYALARLRLPAAGNIAIAIFMTYLVPPIILFLPLTYVIGQLGLFDSWWALVLVYPTFTIPIATWLMFGFLRGLPPEIEVAMQEYLYAVVMAAPVDQKVVTVGLPTMLIRGDIYFWGALMAGGLLVGVPAAVLFSAVVDRFIQGLTMASD
ncbi:MAG: sugar ABC transporter permease [Candidatus Rokuibacteriota bacterium]|nr:MAG: sugar ABC transporter permease [Candidatus Rokubacteria bacterium]